MSNMKPPRLGQSFKELKEKAREIPEVKEYLNSYSVVIGNIVFARRAHLGYTQKQLADMAKTTQHRISEIESGTGNVTMEVMDRVFRSLRLVQLDPTFDEQSAARD
ncbi:helix-turn-helix domain-containing protein [Paenibacillus hodogayensis]|uniref:Helix-turn-helix domain-containing protein n=1 Tax=Paenibacillus hodogayensis TaxID=279208 RepID=A0ABV5W0K7_9BACL